jgi:predicted dehydrogenase
MHLVIVGCGRIAQAAHLPALERVENIQLTGVVDRSPAIAKGVAARWGVEAFTDLEHALQGVDADAVLITVPDRLHASLAEQALRAGRHVLIEKPLTNTSAEARRLAEVVAETGKILRVANMKRHDPGVIQARRAVVEDLGPVLSFSAWYRNSAFSRSAEVFWPRMITDPAVASAELGFKSDKRRYWLMTHGSHLWDTVRYVIGDVTDVRARWSQVGEDMTWQTVAQLASGGVGTTDLTIYEHGEGGEGLNVRCAHGSLHLRIYNPFIHRAADVEIFTDAHREILRPAMTYANAYERQLRSFASAVNQADGNDAGDVDGLWGIGATVADGLATVRLLEATRDSALTGEKVSA